MRLKPSLSQKKLVIERKNRYFSISRYGRIEVTDTVENGAEVRLLLVNGTRESATFLAPGLRNLPVFEYIRTIGNILRENDFVRDTLLIGGAGFSLPKFYITYFPGRRMDVVENNPEMVDIARRFFFLEELDVTLEADEQASLRTIIDDGLHFLATQEAQYDMIINDAFVGRVADNKLAGEDGVQKVYDRLRPGGVYLVNAITARTGQGSMPGVMAIERMSRVFGNAKMIPVREDYPAHESQNVILYAKKASAESADALRVTA
ncbi:MAG: fused MFS/spermidine synthase [Lachnospiraceae bacterium]|nr:fused MFS/spermidine synthase [Lachnospiraceae bacterium]